MVFCPDAWKPLPEFDAALRAVDDDAKAFLKELVR